MNKKFNRILLFIAILLYIPLSILQIKIINPRKAMENLESRILLMPGQMAGSLVLSGFKGIAADLLWLNIEDFWHKGQHYKMLPLFDAVSWLQPEYVSVWAIGGWHMSYNIFHVITENTKEFYAELISTYESLDNAERKRVQPVINIAKALWKMNEEMSAYNTKWLTEKEMPEAFILLNRYEEELSKIEQTHPDMIKITHKLLASVREQIEWYERGINFLTKGVSYNTEKYDVYFELGWTYYHKGQDYPNAAKQLAQAVKFPHPAYVDNVLAHAYELNGQVDKALEIWETKLKENASDNVARRAVEKIKKDGAFSPKRRTILGLDKY